MSDAVVPRGSGGKFLTFFLGAEEYGLEILKVQEIIGMTRATPVPGAPSHLLGVINLRGKVIPVVDLRRRFGLPAVEPTPETCIVVVERGGARTGILVDRVSEVIQIPDADVQETPRFGPEVRTEYVQGVGLAKGGVRLLLDVERVLAENESGIAVAAEETSGDPGVEAA